jgi:succinate dehydrogenase/fumarate reductase flavoprotein subunit
MNWLASNGTVWLDMVYVGGGTTFPRAHVPAAILTPGGGIGTGWIAPLQRFVDNPANNVQTIMETRATELITQNGRVTGVKATGRNGDQYTITARNGVVLSTGGFAGSVEMRMQYDRQWDGMLTANLPNTNTPSTVGDGVHMARAVGANFIDMGLIQVLAFGCPLTGSPLNFANPLSFFINEQGHRFVSENARRDDMTKALLQSNKFQNV